MVTGLVLWPVTLVHRGFIQEVWAVKNRSERPKVIQIILTPAEADKRQQTRETLVPHACLAINSNHHSLLATCLIQRSTMEGQPFLTL
ncbi:hypothetical protein V6Z11_A03G141100 [Gossypium hirsutum]|uniref:Uncharacterized protein n=1 Tax=Gossypium tomentosum TaxID=34277 RepID=A0A5D2R9R5_GOSTO|nr:hypothetical protein ES332_A03G142600v1 [Gossypium tomentosum]